MHRLFIRLGTLFLVCFWTWGAAIAASPGSNPSDHPNHSILRGSIPVKIYRGFLVVALGQFGAEIAPQNFIIDTGTSPSILNIGVAKHLGLPLSQSKLSAIGRQHLAKSF